MSHKTKKTDYTSNPQLELKGATALCTWFNGHMFSYFEKDGALGLRLPEKKGIVEMNLPIAFKVVRV